MLASDVKQERIYFGQVKVPLLRHFDCEDNDWNKSLQQQRAMVDERLRISYARGRA